MPNLAAARRRRSLRTSTDGKVPTNLIRKPLAWQNVAGGRAAIFLAILLAGCAEIAPSLESTPDPDASEAEEVAEGVVDDGALMELTFGSPAILEPPGNLVWEPSIYVDQADRVFVHAFVAHLWRSLDGGQTFEAMGTPRCEVPLPACPPYQTTRDAGLVSGSDGALQVDSQGRLHWAGLGGSLDPPPAVPYQYSDDGGVTWSDPLDVAVGHDTDRQWLMVGADDVVRIVWRDSGERLVDPIRQAIEGQPQLLVVESRDRGATWSKPVQVLERQPIPGPWAADRVSGALYLPVAEDGVSMLRSLDGGAKWSLQSIPDSGNLLFVIPWASVDANGTVYVVWATAPDPMPMQTGVRLKTTEIPHVYLAYSKDNGSRWSEPSMISPPDRPALMPTLVAGRAGRVAVAWYEGSMDLPSEHTPQEWRVRVMEGVRVDTANPQFVSGFATPDPVLFGSICTQGSTCSDAERTRGDFFEITLRPNGQPIVAFSKDRLTGGLAGFEVDVAVVQVMGTPVGPPIGQP